MADPDIPTEALEAAARAIAARAHSKRHGQLCPCWTKGAPIGECDCWILTKARGDANAAAPHLIAEGRRQASDAIRAAGVLRIGNTQIEDVERAEKAAWAAAIAEGTDHG